MGDNCPDSGGDSSGGIIDSIGDFFGQIGDALGGILSAIVDLPGKIIDGIVNGVKGFFDFLGTLLNKIIDLISGLVDLIIDGFKSLLTYLFVPTDGFWDDQFGRLQTTVSSKVGIDGLNTILASLQQVNDGAMPDFTMTLNGQAMTILDTSYLIDNLGILHMIIRAIVFALLLRYNINNVYKLIRKDNLNGGGGDDI